MPTVAMIFVFNKYGTKVATFILLSPDILFYGGSPTRPCHKWLYTCHMRNTCFKRVYRFEVLEESTFIDLNKPNVYTHHLLKASRGLS